MINDNKEKYISGKTVQITIKQIPVYIIIIYNDLI
jgi:hypothetical protein